MHRMPAPMVCADKDKGARQVLKGQYNTTVANCAQAKDLCQNPKMGSSVRGQCPWTCGTCPHSISAGSSQGFQSAACQESVSSQFDSPVKGSQPKQSAWCAAGIVCQVSQPYTVHRMLYTVCYTPCTAHQKPHVVCRTL